jgi:pimeloyl-ACP methyl ester carboxylesterase
MVFVFGDCELDLSRFELRRAGAVQPVEPQVFDVLAVLLRERHRVVKKEELLDTVWGNRFVSESTLSSRLKAARRAIGDDGQAQRLIRTVHGRGYQFVGEVTESAVPQPPTTTSPPPQQIKFCTVDDGVRLAYATMGGGRPLVKVANWLSHLDYDWHSPVWRHWLSELSRRFHLLRYDERGCGLSDWEVPRFSFDAWVDDLEAVVDAAGFDRFPLLGISQGAAVAIAYAVRHPERVTHLVLLGGFAKGRRKRARTNEELELTEARIDMARLAWGRADATYRQIFVARFLPEATQDEWKVFDELQRQSTSPENAWRFLNEFADIDVADLAPKVRAPSLILSSRREPDSMFEQSRLLASHIPGSRLVPLDSANHLLPEYDPAWTRFLAELDAFLPSRPGPSADDAALASDVDRLGP